MMCRKRSQCSISLVSLRIRNQPKISTHSTTHANAHCLLNKRAANYLRVLIFAILSFAEIAEINTRENMSPALTTLRVVPASSG